MLALVLWDKAGKPPWNSAPRVPRVESVGLPMRNNALKTWDSGAWFSSCQRDAGKSETSVVCQPHRFWPKQYAFHGQSNHPSSLDHCTPVEAAAQLAPTTQYTAWDPLPEVLMSALLAVAITAGAGAGKQARHPEHMPDATRLKDCVIFQAHSTSKA